MSQPSVSPTSLPQRRSFLTRLNAGAAAMAAGALGGRAVAQTKPAAKAPWEPARHDQDNWMDELPGKHRIVFDTVTYEAMGNALLFANKFLIANRTGYGLQSNELAVIVVARHFSTGFAYNNTIWAKWGAQMALGSSLTNPATNPYLAGEAGMETLAKQGVHFAICEMATARLAGFVARATGSTAAAITKELTANLVSNAHMVPAGVVILNRAQERGYTLVTA